MAPRKKATKRGTARKPATKSAGRSAKKTTKKAAKRSAPRTAKTARKGTKKAAKKGAARKAAAPRTRSTKFSTRKPGVFTQTDLIDNIEAMNPELTKSQTRQVVNDVLDTLQNAIKKTDRVRLKGVGTITKKKVPARKGGKLVKNPFTGEMVKQKPRPASVKVKMNPAKEIKDAK